MKMLLRRRLTRTCLRSRTKDLIHLSQLLPNWAISLLCAVARFVSFVAEDAELRLLLLLWRDRAELSSADGSWCDVR